MNKHELDLYQRIQAFDFDKVDVKITFTQRLQREHRWTAAYASRVVDEYRKFLLLAMVAGHKIIPSDQVDQAWHLHLTNSRSYWDELCPKILGKNLHHEANPGGRSEQINHHHGYQQTLASYELIFGQTPPEDIWPSAEIRFGRDIHFVRVNSSQNWIIKKPDINFKGLYSPVFLITWSLFLVGCGTFETFGDVAKRSSDSELFFYTLLILLLEFGLLCLLNMIDKCFTCFLRNKTRSIPLTTDELAYLRGGYKGILELSMVKSVQQFYSDPTVYRTADIAAYWQGQAKTNAIPQYKCLRTEIIEKQLIKKGLLTPPTPSFFLMACMALLMISVQSFSLVIIVGNIQSGVIAFIVSMISLFGQYLLVHPCPDDHPCSITRTCKQMLYEKQIQIESKICELQTLHGKLTDEQLNVAVAIMGLDALRYSEFPELAGLLNDHISSTLLPSTSGNKSDHSDSGSDTSGGCSSHDSSSFGCAGGCGGCGGGD
ncbi:MAG: hypothetical protein ABL884_05455 [Methyloglobulus sp.]